MKLLSITLACCAALIGGITASAQEEATSGTVGVEAVANDEFTSDGIRLNFRNASLDSVLDYLSKEAGFAVVRMTDVSGRIDLQSQQPLTADETVNLLNTALYAKGYAAIRSDRILMIVPLSDARKRAIPVRIGNDPEKIPRTDTVVTHIIPVRYVDATKLVDNLNGLLSENATLSSNESSNALVLTDTQNNIRRITEIVRALDTSISQITAIRVFPLQYSDSKEMADLINQVFEVSETTNRDNNNNRFPGPWGGRRGGGDDNNNSSDSVARTASMRVLAAADERTNAVVVSAPEDLMPTIEKLITDTDTSNELVTVYRVFLLKRADAEDMAKLINDLFEETSASSSEDSGPGGPDGPRGFFRRMMERSQQQSADSDASQRSQQESAVLAVADTRTNAVVVSAVESQMTQIERIIENLDAEAGKNKEVFVYSLQNADAVTVKEILGAMFNDETRSSSSSSSTSSNSSSSRSSSSTNNFGRN
ncbi:hypothetical protein JXA32_14720 [Candidatus Sumerlaeota bacterium]|nr:hypothetical protein [Candidatus Sumerlaeota bacterium]